MHNTRRIVQAILVLQAYTNCSTKVPIISGDRKPVKQQYSTKVHSGWRVVQVCVACYKTSLLIA